MNFLTELGGPFGVETMSSDFSRIFDAVTVLFCFIRIGLTELPRVGLFVAFFEYL